MNTSSDRIGDSDTKPSNEEPTPNDGATTKGSSQGGREDVPDASTSND